MKGMRILGLAGVLLFLTIQAAVAADVAKIGVVNTQKVLMNSDAGKAIQNQINQTGQKMEADLKRKGKEIEDLKARLQREAMVLSKEVRDERERDIRIKINDLKSSQLKHRRSLQLLEKRLLSRMKKQIQDVAAKLGKKGGYLLIIDRAGVIYAPAALDITDRLIRQFNADYAKMHKKAATAAPKTKKKK